VLRLHEMSEFPAEFSYPVEELPKKIPVGSAVPKYSDAVSLLVVHTPNAVVAAGSQADFDAKVANSIADLQIALANSSVIQTSIAHVTPGGAMSMEVNYDESPTITNVAGRWYTHRAWARESLDVRALRDAYEADVVVMMVGDVGTCGIAYIQQAGCTINLAYDAPDLCDAGQMFSEFPYSVVSSVCDVANIEFAHEVGHNFGMQHDPGPYSSSNGSAASFVWSFGYTASTSTVQARTVMAYENNPADPNNCPFGCPRYLHFSNPNVDFFSYPGTPSGTLVPDGGNRSSFNARTASLFSEVMSGYRGAVVVDRIFRNGIEALPDL
jgi:hypothetical protein